MAVAFLKPTLRDEFVSCSNIMKTAQELSDSLQQQYTSNRYVLYQPMYQMQKSGKIWDDFAKFTDLQSGGKSDNKTDYYYLNTVNPAPPVPDSDGRYYHTVRDVTWQLYKTLFPDNTPAQFYAMSNSDREAVVEYMIKPALITKSDTVNGMFAYAVWGTGNCHAEQVYYQAWYTTDINADIDTLGEKAILDRITDIRLYVLSTFTTTANNPGQPAGILNLWALLKQYT